MFSTIKNHQLKDSRKFTPTDPKKTIRRMKTKSFATWPSILPESALVKYNPAKSPKRSPGIVKMMPQVPPPDEETVHFLNALASTPPFCTFRKARRHDML
jgi:hypothetical protein